jgi:hypothetical protein
MRAKRETKPSLLNILTWKAIFVRGNCYVTSEALYHLMGGKSNGWLPKRMRHEGDTHWFLFNRLTGQIVDATAHQFKTLPDYDNGIGCGFLTAQPSKRARALMQLLLWQ